MTYKRFIPVLFIKDGLLVRSNSFETHQAIGDPLPTIKRLSDWNVDELILLNISKKDLLDSRRTDKWHNIGKTNFSTLVKACSEFCFMPLSVGGRIRTIEDIDNLFHNGADKVIVNTILFEDPELVRKAVSKYGSQAIVASLDFKLELENNFAPYHSCGKSKAEFNFQSAIEHVTDLGIGELFLSSIDHDGSAKGYDHNLLSNVENLSNNLPIIINSGATQINHFLKALELENIDAIAAGNIFYFTELSYPKLKLDIMNANKFSNVKLRSPKIGNKFINREPKYNPNIIKNLLAKGIKGNYVDTKKYLQCDVPKVSYCKQCLYPSISASPSEYDKNGICMGCVTSNVKLSLKKEDYLEKEELLRSIVKKQLSNAKNREYDCIVSVSGGKDSYYQTHYVKKILGLNPLLVTYNGNNYSEEGLTNLYNMREVFDCDHLIVSPSVDLLKKLNRLAFIAMGDMNWHNHMGIYTTAPRIATQMNIPLVFWGEHGYLDLCGQFSMYDFPEVNYRERLEHDGRGFEWNFFVGLNGINSSHMQSWKYPADQKLFDLNLKQIFLGNYIYWESNKHLELMVEKYGFKVSSKPFDRTYRMGSNLDDIHENGIHDYLKYVKFGYGRCTDHASKDIRAGIISRKEGIKLVKKYDHVIPSDLKRWLSYVDMQEEEFHRIADHFRDPRVWANINGEWLKNDIE